MISNSHFAVFDPLEADRGRAAGTTAPIGRSASNCKAAVTANQALDNFTHTERERDRNPNAMMKI